MVRPPLVRASYDLLPGELVVDNFAGGGASTGIEAAIGRPVDIAIAPTHNGKPLTKTAQIAMAGNSVCPQVAAAVVGSQLRSAA